jgi:hypothetical protein
MLIRMSKQIASSLYFSHSAVEFRRPATAVPASKNLSLQPRVLPYSRIRRCSGGLKDLLCCAGVALKDLLRAIIGIQNAELESAWLFILNSEFFILCVALKD